MPNLDSLLEDEDFVNVVPEHLREGCNDILLINELIEHCDDPETFQRLYALMNPKTEAVYHKTIDWHAKRQINEKYALLRVKNRTELEETRQEMKKIFPNGMLGEIVNQFKGIYKAINDSYTSYLSRQGLPTEKINSWRKFLLLQDITVARVFRHNVDKVEPSGFGPYAIAGYPLRKVTRYFMLEGAKQG